MPTFECLEVSHANGVGHIKLSRPDVYNKMSPSFWREWTYTGERIEADKAERIDLVGEVFGTQEQMLEAVQSIAATIAQKSPLVLHGCKDSLIIVATTVLPTV